MMRITQAWHGIKGDAVTTVAGPMAISYAGLSSLPRDPLALDRYLGRLHLPGWGPAPVREFEVISNLLTSYVMPPALTAELYRSLGDIPGVTVDHHAVDVAGRTGVGFQIALPKPFGGGTEELVINPHTYRLMGQQLLTAQATGPPGTCWPAQPSCGGSWFPARGYGPSRTRRSAGR